jgi:type VI secretion system secreted protein VgrG
LLLVGFTGHEALSQLFSFQLDLVAESRKEVAFDKLLGQKVTVQLALAGDKTRPFSGICKRISQGERDDTFTKYRMELVPQFWLLTKRSQSRIFQHQSVPDILKKVLQGLDVAYEIQGTFEPRDYCVQYRETDFNFACRLMEEEGIYYFFKHADDGHKMVLANTPASHSDMPGHAAIIFETMTAGSQLEDRIFSWEKAQELRSGKVTLWDHCFELPHKHLEADQTILESVEAGQIAHKLKVAGNDKLEIYDFPGAYAQRFDGIDKGGGEQPAGLTKIFQDNKRTVGLRMQQEAVAGLTIEGSSTCRHLVSGHKFALQKHFNGDGSYVVTRVQHTGRSMQYRSGDGEEFRYQNSFSCIPIGVAFRPQRTAPKPSVQGSQTAVVVGPAGEEISCDKYGRVKVQFHWDRDGKNNADSSCWARVSTLWGGKQWGMIHIPRIGQEVIVDFLEGDPDQPIITGSVYNAEMMPPYKLPADKTQSGIKSRSSLKGTEEHFNEFCFEDKKGEEFVYLRAEKDNIIAVENDEYKWVGNDRLKTIDHDETTHVKHDRTETVDNDEDITIGNNRTEKVKKNESISIGGDRTEGVGGDEGVQIRANRSHSVGKDETLSVAGNRKAEVGKSEAITVTENREETIGKKQTIKIGTELYIEVGEQITIKTGEASLVMKKNGDIQIKGKEIMLVGSGKITAKASSDVVLKGSNVKMN